MSVILLILKIIGIGILAIIGIIALCILSGIFYPMGYRVECNIEEQTRIHVGVHWLFYLVYLRFQMVDGKRTAVLYLCGVKKQLYPPVEKRKKRTHAKRTDACQQEESCDASEDTEYNKNMNAPEDAVSPQKSKIQKESVNPEVESKTELTNDKVETSKASESDKKLFGQLREKIIRIFIKVWDFLKSLPRKIKQIFDKTATWKAIITDKGNQGAVKLVWREIRYLLSHYKPYKLIADIRYGFDDPAVTGKSLAVISMIPFLHKKKVQIVPVFETDEFFVRGRLEGRGHIRLFHLIRVGLHIWKDKNCKKIIRKLRK